MIELTLMNVERSQIGLTRKEIIKKSLAEISIQNAGKVILHMADRIVEASPVIYPENIGKIYHEAILDGYFPFVIGSHQSHFDALAISKVTRDLTTAANKVLPENNQTKGFLMPIAITVGSGHQDQLLKIMYEKIGPILKKNHITPVDMTRAKDREINPDFTPNKREFTKEMLTKMKEGHRGIILFPEGTVQGGRLNEFGKPNGMQKLAEGSISTFTNFGEHISGKVMYIPVGIDGTRNILRGDKRPPLSSIALGLLSPSPSLAIIRVGEPIFSDDPMITKLKNGEKDIFLGKKIAELIPPHMRGVYA